MGKWLELIWSRASFSSPSRQNSWTIDSVAEASFDRARKNYLVIGEQSGSQIGTVRNVLHKQAQGKRCDFDTTGPGST